MIERYPHRDDREIFSKTFQIKSTKNLSVTAKFILNSFQNKYIYYAINDILYQLTLTLEERDYLLEILYSPIISLQNNRFVSFFDIWINEIYIDKLLKSNRFLSSKNAVLPTEYIITVKVFYTVGEPVQKKEPLW